MEFADRMDFLQRNIYMSICTRNRWKLFVTIVKQAIRKATGKVF